MNSMTILTDHKGAPVVQEPEPPHGSVVLVHGQTGTAWQRFADGRWHPTRGGGGRTWEQLMCARNVILIYVAPVRTGDRRHSNER